jgi:hypothetical protein
MKSLLTTLFALSLAACTNYGNFDRERPSNLAAPTGHVLSQTKSIPNKSLAARAEASKTDVNESINSSLMECVSNACKAQCAPGSDKQSRPKWCMYFKEPADGRALSATSDIQRKSAE